MQQATTDTSSTTISVHAIIVIIIMSLALVAFPVKYASVKVDSESVLKLSFSLVTEDNWSLDKVAF